MASRQFWEDAINKLDNMSKEEYIAFMTKCCSEENEEEGDND